jgi:hypothetical protein
VDYHLYLHKLVSPFDFHGSARDIFEWSFDCCRCGSSPRALFSSVPQGSVPSPLSFLCSELPLPLLFLGDDIALNWKDVVTDLGLLINCRLRFGRHVTKICSRVYSTLHRLRLLKLLTPKSVRLKLCKALLLPHFFYCDIVFAGLSCLDSRRLQVAFNSCTRYVFGIRRFDHLSVHRDVLLGMPLFFFFFLV